MIKLHLRKAEGERNKYEEKYLFPSPFRNIFTSLLNYLKQ